jgi:tRNA(Arg) A34 adenosine deaminase TadA
MNKPQTRATPFEVYLAARRYKCRILLYFKDTWFQFSENEFAPVILLEASVNREETFRFQWYKTAFEIFKLESSIEHDRFPSLASCIRAALCQNDVRPASAPSFFSHKFFAEMKEVLPSAELSAQEKNLAQEVANFYNVKVQFFTASPLFSKPEHEFTPTVYIDQDPKPPTIMIFHCHENVAVSWISRAFSRTKEPGGREKVPVSCKVEITELFKELFAYPKHFERFFAALQQSATKQRVSDVDKMKSFFYKCFRYFYSSTPLIDCHKEMFGRTPPTVPDCTSQTSAEIPQKVSEVWDAIKIKCRSEFQKAGTVEKSAHPLASFVFWIMSHCRIDHDCHGTSIIQNFLEGEPGSFPKMADFLRILYEYRVWHFFEKEGDYTYQCMFEGKQHEYLFSLCNCDAPNALNDFAKLQLESSFMTSRWLRRNTGRSYKLWGHMSDHEYDKCEVQKCTSKNEKWRHMIYAYAIMALLWNEYNGNKEGPIGDYPDRRDSEIGRMLDPASFQSLLEHIKSSASAQANGESLQKILKDLEKAKFVFPSKQGEKPVDYHGHNIVALAVGKRGDILRIAYNHNTLFSSTVDHAEERLIDGLYKDPEAFVQKSHARIYNVSASRKQKMEVEKHMQHISVYTSLEQCQQCAGKFHLALVPEVIFCQRDWEIQLLQQKLYEQHHKCRPVPASFFGFSPYEELALGYLNYCEKIDASGENGVEFFRFDEKEKPVPAKKTMPYFLCSNDAQQIFRRGSFIFHRVLFILYHQDQGNRPRFTKRILNDDLLQPSDADIPSFFYRETDLGVTVTKDDVKSLIEACNLDVSDWMATVYDEKSPTWNDEVKDDGYPSVQNSPHASIRHRNGSAVHQSVVADDLDASLIRNFRPSLRIKQNRLCQDELISHRRRWTDILFKQRCTLKFFFDKYAVIDELDIDSNIGPLGEIRSVYLGRASSGSASLKGTFDVTFSSVDEAKEVKEYFRNIACKSGTIFLKDESVVSPHKRKKVVAAILSAACWIYSIREPNECELFISYSDVGALAPSESFDKIDEKIERQFPGQTTSTKVRTLKFSNVSSKRRMQKYFFGQPRIFFSHSIPLHHPWPGDQMHSDAPYYLSLISRIDVSEGELLELLRKCVTRNRLKVLPPHFRIHSSKLTTCNSNKTLKWLHFVSQTPAAKTAAVVDWKLWNVKFKSKFEFVEEGLQSFLAGMGTNKFCQSFPQCVFDFAFEVGDMPCSIRWNPFSISKMSVEQQKIFKWDSSTHAFCLTIVMDKSLNHNQKLIRISPLELRKRTDFGKQLAELKELNFMVCQDFSIFQIDKVPEDALREIKIDENCIATLIVSDMLITNHHDVEYLWENWAFVPAIKKRILAQQQDFWGGDIQQILKQADEDKQPYNLPRNMIPFVQFMDFLKIAKSKNVFGFAIQSLPNPNPNPNPNLPIMNFRTPTKGVAFGCQYCGICTVFTGVDVDFCSGFSFRCIGHITQEKTRDEIPSFGKYVTELSENREHNDANVFVSEAKINSKGNSLIEKIDFLEKQLNLIMSVQSSVSFDNVIKEKTITSDEGVFKSVCQQDNVPSYNLFLNLVLRRDSFDGSAHVAFRIDGLPNFQAMTVDVQILGEVFCSTTDTSAPVPCTPVANSIKPTLAVDQESNFRLYGRLRCLPEKKDPEGGVIPANVLRYFFEPEYFWCDYQNTWAAPVPFPTIDVIIKGPVEQDHFFILRHVNSWDFEELQSFPLRELMKLLKDLQMERIKLHANDKKSSRIASGRKSGQSGALKWFLHFDEHQKAKTIGEKILFANLVRVDCTGTVNVLQRKF